MQWTLDKYANSFSLADCCKDQQKVQLTNAKYYHIHLLSISEKSAQNSAE